MSESMKVVALPGDGVGPEVTRAAISVLEWAAGVAGRGLELDERPVGWSAVQAGGAPLPEETLEACLAADAVFLGAVGDPAADHVVPELRPETGLLRLRRELGCHANLRPVRMHPGLEECSPLRPDRVRGMDLVFVRELGGGIYYGEPRLDEGARALDTMVYTVGEVARIASFAWELAAARRGRVTSIDKANVLASSRLWRRTVERFSESWAGPAVSLDHLLVDRAAMELVLRPTEFDVVLTSNLFGDVLSDEAGALVGSLGLLPSASLGGTTDIYEPVHGSAPDLTGRGIANPTGAIASIALMLRHTFDMRREASLVEAALDATFQAGVRTPDLGGEATTGHFSTSVLERLGGGG